MVSLNIVDGYLSYQQAQTRKMQNPKDFPNCLAMHIAILFPKSFVFGFEVSILCMI